MCLADGSGRVGQVACPRHDRGHPDIHGIEKLAQYIARCPFSQARMVKVNAAGQVIYRAEHSDPRDFPHWRAIPTGSQDVAD